MRDYTTYVPTISWKNFFITPSVSYKIVLFWKLLFNDQTKWEVQFVGFFCKILNIRFIHFRIYALGHLLMEPDLFLKEKALGCVPNHLYIWIIDKQVVANWALLNSWKKRIPHIYLRWIDFQSGYFRKFCKSNNIFYDTEKYIVAVDQTGMFGELQKKWGNRSPVLSIEPEWRKKGYIKLGKLGVPKGSWFACLHCREQGYHRFVSGQFFRNANIETYLKAIEFVVSSGGWVLRLGDSSMTKLPEMDHVIDYAHSEYKADWFDLFLGSECRYFVGSASGPTSLAPAYAKPMCMANCLPLSATPFYCHDGQGIATPKLLFSSKEKRFLTFAEIMSSEIGSYRFTELYENADLEWVDNDADDILNMTRELHDLSRGCLELSPED